MESSGRAHSVPRPAFGGAMLTLLRVRRVARLRRRPGARRRVPPASQSGLLAAFILRVQGPMAPCHYPAAIWPPQQRAT
jgi:hypothetical protein